MKIEIYPEGNRAILHFWTDNEESWTYAITQEAYGHICGHLQTKGVDEQTANDIASTLIQQALDYGRRHITASRSRPTSCELWCWKQWRRPRESKPSARGPASE